MPSMYFDISKDILYHGYEKRERERENDSKSEGKSDKASATIVY